MLGDKMDFPSFRQQAAAKAPWELNQDARLCFSQSVNNNQLQMALYYSQELFEEFDKMFNEMKIEINELHKEIQAKSIPTPAAKATRPSTKSVAGAADEG